MSDHIFMICTLRFFISHRRARVTVSEKEAIALDSEEAIKKKELEAEERRKQSHDMVADSIRRELAESAPYCF